MRRYGVILRRDVSCTRCYHNGDGVGGARCAMLNDCWGMCWLRRAEQRQADQCRAWNQTRGGHWTAPPVWRRLTSVMTSVTPTVVATKMTNRILSTTVATSCHSARTLVCLSRSAARASFDLIILSTRSRVRWNCCSSWSLPPRTSSIDVSCMSLGRDARPCWPPALPATPAAESTTNGWDCLMKYEDDSDPFWRRVESSMSCCCCWWCWRCELGDSTSSLYPMFYSRQSTRWLITLCYHFETTQRTIRGN